MKERGETEDVVIKVIASIGLVSLSVIAPNALGLLKPIISKDKQKQKEYYIRNKVIKNLKEKGLVSFEKTNKGTFVRLTSKGKSLVEKIEEKELKINKPKRWDKKWRVIIFDIKENRRKTRDQFRRQLQNLDFIQIQRSVWVHPYPCDSLVKMLKADLSVGKDILYMTVESLENDGWLRREFGLF